MSTVYIAIPSPDRLEANTQTFLAAIASGSSEPQNKVFTEIAFDFVDLILEGLLHGPTRQIELHGFRKKLVDGLGSVLEKTTHGLIKAVVAKLANDELKGLRVFVEERRLALAGKPYVSFPLPQHFTTRFMVQHEATMSGNRDNPDAQADVMNELVDIALDYLLKRPTDLIKLGFLARKGVDIGYSSIRSVAHSTIRKLAHDLSLEENQKVSRYFYELMREGPDYKDR